MARARPGKCMKLIHERVPGEEVGRVDVCGKDAGHEGEHEGKYAKMTWQDTERGPVVDQHGHKVDYTGGTGPDVGMGPRGEPAVA